MSAGTLEDAGPGFTMHQQHVGDGTVLLQKSFQRLRVRRLRLVPHRTLPQEDGKLLTALEHDEDGLLRCPTLRAQLQP